MILNFQNHTIIVKMEKVGKNITYMMDFCLELTNFVYQIRRFDFFLLQESHAGGITGNFGQKKTYKLLSDHFYWPKMRRDVIRFVERCVTCHKANSKLNPHNLYTPLFPPKIPCEDISMDFILGLSRTQKREILFLWCLIVFGAFIFLRSPKTRLTCFPCIIYYHRNPRP
jgi:hypothetical protein